MPRTATAPRFRPRRRPLLRVVGSEEHRTLHANVVRIGGIPYVIEVWTDAEIASLPPGLRPTDGFILPGLGWMTVDITHSEAPRYEDVIDVAEQALAAWRAR